MLCERAFMRTLLFYVYWAYRGVPGKGLKQSSLSSLHTNSSSPCAKPEPAPGPPPQADPFPAQAASLMSDAPSITPWSGSLSAFPSVVVVQMTARIAMVLWMLSALGFKRLSRNGLGSARLFMWFVVSFAMAVVHQASLELTGESRPGQPGGYGAV